ncbi:hypothetical protein LMG28727_07085 [Paraburkholderia kirstenboschensis]|nr:hypothetical protein LMG28727_07085 [Paraburkholderia kirstenboschensis]
MSRQARTCLCKLAPLTIAAAIPVVESWLRGMRGARCYKAPRASIRKETLVVSGERLRAPRIYINVGGRAIVPDLPGIESDALCWA